MNLLNFNIIKLTFCLILGIVLAHYLKLNQNLILLTTTVLLVAIGIILLILKNKIVEDNMICENGLLLDCFDLARTSKSFQSKVYGIKLCLHDYQNNRTYLVACFVDDILISCLENPYISVKIGELQTGKPKDIEYDSEHWDRFIDSLTIKDLLVYSPNELSQRFVSILNQLILIKQKTITQVVKEFLNKNNNNKDVVVVQGLGFVGAVMSIVVSNSSKKDYAVIGVDRKESIEIIDNINNGIFPIKSSDPKIEEYYQKSIKKGSAIEVNDLEIKDNNLKKYWLKQNELKNID